LTIIVNGDISLIKINEEPTRRGKMTNSIKYKRIEAGSYKSNWDGHYISIYKTNFGWGAEIEIGKYGDDNWLDTSTHGYTKRDVVASVQAIVNSHYKTR
jgi:hypothetical protein